jgi:hypothetical protein
MLRRAVRWLIGIAAAMLVLAIVVAIGWALSVPLADRLAYHDVGSARGPLLQTARDAARGRLLTYAAGAFAAVALVFTAWNVILYRSNLSLYRRTNEIAEQGQVTDRYTKAIEQLGSDKLDVRIGGIYALERIARDSATDRPAVMEVLTAFIREHSREHLDPSKPGRPPRPDVLAAVTVVRRRNADRDIQPLNLADAYLVRTSLAGANLDNADLTRADLTRADLSGADLSGANLYLAQLIDADLRHATLSGANLNAANLHDAMLDGADLTGADLSVSDLSLAILIRANLTDADLGGAFLGGATLEGAELAGADLSEANLTDAKWHEEMPPPRGWERDADGRLRRAGDGPGRAGED